MQHMTGEDFERANDFCYTLTLIFYLASLYEIVSQSAFEQFNVMNAHNIPVELFAVLDPVYKAFEETTSRPSFEHFEAPQYLSAARKKLEVRATLHAMFDKYGLDGRSIETVFPALEEAS